MQGIFSVLAFIVAMACNLLIFLMLLRVAFRYVGISPLHPVGQLVYQTSSKLLSPLEKLFPTLGAPQQRVDILGIVGFVAVVIIKIILMAILLYGQWVPFSLLMICTLADVLVEPLNLMFYLVLIRIIINFVRPDWDHPAQEILVKLTDPLLMMGRKLIPDISGFDFSPIVVLASLKILSLVIAGILPVNLL